MLCAQANQGTLMLKIYHNPRCSKSRQTLALLEGKGLDVQVIEYLKTTPNPAELGQIIKTLGMQPRELLRNKEAEFKLAGLDNKALSNEEIIVKMTEFPKLIERPIVINGDKAAIGRPPENVLEIL